jgi:hypothetical protein
MNTIEDVFHSFRIGRRNITLALTVDKKKIKVGRAIKCPTDRQNIAMAKTIAIGRAKNPKTTLLSLDFAFACPDKPFFKSILVQLEEDHKMHPFRWFKRDVAHKIKGA